MILGLVVIALVAFGVALALWHPLSATREQLAAARSTLEAVAAKPNILRTSEGRIQAMHDIDNALAHVNAANKTLHHSVVLSIAGDVPGLRTQKAGLLMLADDARRGSLAGRALIAQVDEIA